MKVYVVIYQYVDSLPKFFGCYQDKDRAEKRMADVREMAEIRGSGIRDWEESLWFEEIEVDADQNNEFGP